MSDLIKLLGIELQDISLFLLIATVICFLLVSLISRLIANILQIKNHHRLIWIIDVLLLPLAILVFHIILHNIFISQLTCPRDFFFSSPSGLE